MQKSNFNLASLAVIVVLLGLLISVLFPAVSGSQLYSSYTSIGSQGKDIYVAITAANTEREALGLSSVWPKSNLPTNNVVDIGQLNFTNSTDYFTALYDGDNFGTDQHNPYVRGFDYSELAGAGVRACAEKGRLKPANNMWTIAKNVREDMEEFIPVLVTRNLAAESLPSEITNGGLFKRRLYFDEEWKTPFDEKKFVVIRKNGGVFCFRARDLTYGDLYGHRTFKTTIPGSQAPGLAYLTPNKEVIPSEAVYQACANSGSNPKKGAFYYWWEDLKDKFEAGKYFLIIGLISGILIFVRVVADKKLRSQMSALGPACWLPFWLAVTMYQYSLVTLCSFFASRSISPALILAPAIQLAGCLYIVFRNRKTANPTDARMAFSLIVKAPFIAILALIVGMIIMIIMVNVRFLIR